MRTRPLLIIALIGSFVLLGLGATLPAAKAQGGSWSQTFDFTVDDQGWISDTSILAGASYTAGVGWDSIGGSGGRVIGITTIFATTTVTQVDVYITFDTNPDNGHFHVVYGGSTYGIGTTTLAGNYVWTASATKTGVTQIQIYAGNGTSSGVGNGATYRVTKVIVYGTSTSPFPTGTPSPTPTGTVAPTNTPGPTVVPSGACATAWAKTYDFSDPSQNTTDLLQGWEPRITLSEPEARLGYDGIESLDAPIDSSTHSERLVVIKTFKQSTVLTSIDLTVTYEPGADGSGGKQLLAIAAATNLINGGSPPPSGSRVFSWQGIQVGVSTLTLNIWATGTLPVTQAVDGKATVSKIRLTGTGYDPEGQCTPAPITANNAKWAYPISANGRLDRYAISYIMPPFAAINPGGNPLDGSTFKDAILAFSSKGAGDKVHALIDGTITDIQLVAAGGGCVQAGINVTNDPPDSCFTTVTGLDGTTNLFRAEALSYANAYVITEQIDGGEIDYIVANKPGVQINQAVSKGCILGETLPVYLPPNLVSILDSITSLSFSGVSYHLATEGYTVIEARNSSGDPFDLVPYLTEEPLDKYCSPVSPEVSACKVRNNTFKAPVNSDWSLNPDSTGNIPGNPAGTEQGLRLTGTATQSNINLDTTHNYTITFVAHVDNPSRLVGDTGDPAITFTSQFGTEAAETIKLDSSITSLQQVVIGAAPYTPNRETFYDLVLIGSTQHGSTVILDSVCITDSADLPPAPPGDCILLNPEFDNSNATNRVWTASAGTVTFNGGIVILPDGESISQSLKLSPKISGGQDYTLSVIARRQGSETAGQSIDLTWAWSSQSGTIGTVSKPAWATLTDTIHVTSVTTSTLTITSAATPTSIYAQIDAVCIKTADGDNVPGYQAPPPITASCKVCAWSAVGDINVDLPDLIAWVICQINQIWQCEAKIILLGIWKILIDTLTFLGFVRLWFNALIVAAITWVNSDIQIIMRYINGEVRNVITSLQKSLPTFVQVGTNANIWDVLLAFVNGLRDVLINLINSILSLALALIGLVGSVITLLINGVFSVLNNTIGIVPAVINAIMNGVAHSPTYPAYMPQCDSSSEQIAEACMPFFIIDNSILSDVSPVSLTLPIAMGATIFHLFIWTLGEFRKVFGGNE
jgi:hypothetical protein